MYALFEYIFLLILVRLTLRVILIFYYNPLTGLILRRRREKNGIFDHYVVLIDDLLEHGIVKILDKGNQVSAV